MESALNGGHVVVTGAGGFVGANLVRDLLSRGAVVHAFVRATTDTWRLKEMLRGLELHELDLTDAAAVTAVIRDIDPQVVFHLAKHRGNPATLDYQAAYAANLGATLNLLQAVAGSSTLRRFVHGGSSLEYDLARSPLREDDESTPITVHGVTKAAAARLCQHFAARHGVPAVVLRFFTVYGPWEGPSRFVPSLMTAALERRPVRLTPPGLAHDWIYVGDVVEACVRAATFGEGEAARRIDGEILNVATGVRTSNERILEMVEQLSGQSIAREGDPFPARSWDTGQWVADTTRTATLLGWRAPTPVHEGLAQTWRWFAAHLDLYRAKNSTRDPGTGE